jgi:hypothetical protein
MFYHLYLVIFLTQTLAKYGFNQIREVFWYNLLINLKKASSAAQQIPLCRRMLGLYPGLLLI